LGCKMDKGRDRGRARYLGKEEGKSRRRRSRGWHLLSPNQGSREGPGRCRQQPNQQERLWFSLDGRAAPIPNVVQAAVEGSNCKEGIRTEYSLSEASHLQRDAPHSASHCALWPVLPGTRIDRLTMYSICTPQLQYTLHFIRRYD
jgi:hypothetical protein